MGGVVVRVRVVGRRGLICFFGAQGLMACVMQCSIVYRGVTVAARGIDTWMFAWVGFVFFVFCRSHVCVRAVTIAWRSECEIVLHALLVGVGSSWVQVFTEGKNNYSQAREQSCWCLST